MSFCIECGAGLPGAAKFCPECGTRVPLPAESGPPGAAPTLPPIELPPGLRAKFEAARTQLRGDRREVVVLFADLKGYTALSEKLDPEEVTLLMNALLQRLAGAVYDYEGYVDKFIGDAVMALFGAPLAHENDPERAVLAGLAMLDVMADHNAAAETPLALRVGIHLGEVVAAHLGTEMQLQYTVLGDTVNVASRLESAAEPNTVLVSEAVQDRIQDRFEEVELPPLTLKGKSEPVRAFRIVRYSGGGAGPARPWSPFAGRVAELGRLKSFLERATVPAGALLVEGEAGNGKSRLVAESLAVSRLPTLTVAFSQIRLPGQRAPEVELFERLAAQGEGSAEDRARDLLGSEFETHRRGVDGLLREAHGDGPEVRPSGEDPQAARQNRWLALTALLQAATRRKRMVLLFEDIHWADETARELLEFLVPATSERGIPVLMTSRPGGWEDHVAGVERLTIGPLDDAAAETLVGGRLEELAPEDRRELIRRSQGNPLFLEELVREWKDAGRDARRSVPGTVQGLIKSRIDRLEPPLQLLLQMAAVLGTHFPTRLLSRMYTLEAQPIGFQPAVQALQERGFIEEQSAEERGFRHALMQEVAYGGLLQSVRNVLHESAARIGEEFFADQRDAEAEFFAHHYWNAGLPEAALPHLWSAGRAAFSRYDLPTAEKYLRRAAEVLGPDPDALPDPVERASFAQTLGDVLIQRGDLAEAEVWFGRLEESGRAEERPEWVVRGVERRARVAWYRGELSESARLYEAGLRDLPAGEPGLAADLHNGLGVVHHYQALPDLALDHITRALELRGGDGDRLGMAKCLLNIGSVFLDLREDLDSAERYYQEAYEAAESIGDRQMRYSALNNLGRVATERGEWQEALHTLDRAERVLEEIGWSFARYVTLQNRADCEIALGRLGDAIRHLRICRDRGDTVLGPVNRVTTRIFLFDTWYRMFADDLAAESLVEARAVVKETAKPEELHEILLREGRLLVCQDRWEEAVEVFARAEAEARQHAAPTQIALTAAHRRRAVVRSGGPDPGHSDESGIRSLPYATLLRWLGADADAALEPGPRVLAELGRVVDDAARMGIVSLERAAAERLAGVHAALGDAAAEALALSRAARAMLVLSRGLPPERRERYLEHPRNALLAAHLEPADRAGAAP